MKIERIEPVLPGYNTANNRILIVCEDSTLGYALYKEALPSIYKDLSFGFVSTGGFGGIGKALELYYTDEFDMCIVIYDSGVVRNVISDIKKKLNRFKRVHPDKIILTFSPYCLEYLLMSWETLGYIDINRESQFDFVFPEGRV